MNISKIIKRTNILLVFLTVFCLNSTTVFAGSGEYYVHNLTNKVLFYSVGYYSRGSNSVSAGDYSLGMVMPSKWIAKGWWKINPGEKKRVYKGGEFYLSIDPEGPTQSINLNWKYGYKKVSFCVSNKRYESSKEKSGHVEMRINNKQKKCSKLPCNCSQLGENMRPFYKIEDRSGYLPLRIDINQSDI